MGMTQSFAKHYAFELTPAQWLRSIVSVAVPLGVFGLVSLVADSAQLYPLFFSPFGLPGWIGSIAYMIQLACLGAAYAVLTSTQPKTTASFWLIILITSFIALPFVTPFFDALQLTLLNAGVFLFALATTLRVHAVSSQAGWLISPMMAGIGLATVVGLIMAAAYVPPFAPLYGSTSGAHL